MKQLLNICILYLDHLTYTNIIIIREIDLANQIMMKYI